MHRVPKRSLALLIAAVCGPAGGVAVAATTSGTADRATTTSKSTTGTKPATTSTTTPKQTKPPAKKKKPTTVKPTTVYIEFKLSETYKHVQPASSASWGYTASINEVQPTTASDLTHDETLGGVRLVSSSLTAQEVFKGGTCNWSGGLNGTQEAPDINIQRVGKTSWGQVQWPVPTGLEWKQTLAAGGPSNCPTAAEFSPLEGTSVTASPKAPFSAGEQFFSANFAIPVRTRGFVNIPVSMSTQGAVSGETDQTSASGTITIAWGRCPPGVVPCTPTNS